MGVSEGTQGLKTAVGEYDFAVDAGAIGAISMRSSGVLGSVLPNGSVIMGGYIEVDTLLTSGGAATVAISVEAANDIQTAITVAGAPWSTTGRKSVIPAFTGATTVKTTAARQITATIAAFTVTAGKFRVVLFYR